MRDDPIFFVFLYERHCWHLFHPLLPFHFKLLPKTHFCLFSSWATSCQIFALVIVLPRNKRWEVEEEEEEALLMQSSLPPPLSSSPNNSHCNRFSEGFHFLLLHCRNPSHFWISVSNASYPFSQRPPLRQRRRRRQSHCANGPDNLIRNGRSSRLLKACMSSETSRKTRRMDSFYAPNVTWKCISFFQQLQFKTKRSK